MPKKDKYIHITDEALHARLVKLAEGQGWTETDPLYRRCKLHNIDIVNGFVDSNSEIAVKLRNLMPLHWSRKAQQMRLRRELTMFLKKLGKYDNWRTSYGFELIDDLEKLQGKFKEWQAEVQEMLDKGGME